MNQNRNLRINLSSLTLAGLFAAMITLTTAYIFHIPFGANGGYIHFGDALIYLAAVLLPRPYGMGAAAIGGGLADLMTAPLWAPATILIKSLITLPFTADSPRILNKRNVLAPFLALILSAIGYYLAEWILFGESAALVSITGSLLQSGGSTFLFLALGSALDRIHIKNKLGGNHNGRHPVHL